MSAVAAWQILFEIGAEKLSKNDETIRSLGRENRICYEGQVATIAGVCEGPGGQLLATGSLSIKDWARRRFCRQVLVEDNAIRITDRV